MKAKALSALLDGLEKIVARHPKIQMRGVWRGPKRKHRFRCLLCLSEWKEYPDQLIERAKGCTRCGKPNIRVQRRYKVVTIKGRKFHVQGYEPQGLNWILKTFPSLSIDDLEVETSGKVPVFRYKVGRRYRSYYPDIFIPKLNRVVEIKSSYTMGLDTGKWWRINQAKAKAVLAEGYKFSVLVLTQDGKVTKMPKEWYNKSRPAVLALLGK